jgi:hypothetical protein
MDWWRGKKNYDSGKQGAVDLLNTRVGRNRTPQMTELSRMTMNELAPRLTLIQPIALKTGEGCRASRNGW